MHLLQRIEASVQLAATDRGHHGRAGGKFRIITTFTVIADMAKNVAGTPPPDVTSITKPGAEIHEYQPTPVSTAKRRS